MILGMNVTAFFIGVSTAYYALAAFHLLWGEKRAITRLHKVLGIVFAYWVLSCSKDLILTFPGMYARKTLDVIILCDGWSAITYAAFLFELTMPGWNNWRRLACLSAPFALFTVAYACFPSHGLINAYSWFLGIFGLAILFIGYYKANRYMEYIRANYSNIDEIDISWITYVYLIAFFSQLLWLVTSIIGETLTDCLYYVMALLMWHMVYVHCRNLKQVEPKTEDAAQIACNAAYSFNGNVDSVMVEEKLYLKPNLSLDDLARRLQTNRTYLSSYFSNVRHTSFYDYVNSMRIEKESVPLVVGHPEYTLDYIAKQSGFNSLSTFHRAFRKFTGKTPGNYRNDIESAADNR